MLNIVINSILFLYTRILELYNRLPTIPPITNPEHLQHNRKLYPKTLGALFLSLLQSGILPIYEIYLLINLALNINHIIIVISSLSAPSAPATTTDNYYKNDYP